MDTFLFTWPLLFFLQQLWEFYGVYIGALKIIIMCVFEQTTLTFASSQTSKDLFSFPSFFQKGAYLISSGPQGPDFSTGTTSPSFCFLSGLIWTGRPGLTSLHALFQLYSLLLILKVTTYSGSQIIWDGEERQSFIISTSSHRRMGWLKKILKTGKTFGLIARFNFFIYFSLQTIPRFLFLLLLLCTLLRLTSVPGVKLLCGLLLLQDSDVLIWRMCVCQH